MASKKQKVNLTDCSADKLKRIAEKCGFCIYNGRKHYKVKTVDGKFVTMIPRHNCISKFTIKGIINAFMAFGADIEY